MSFEAFAVAHGLQISALYPADRVQRCATVDKPRARNGAFFWDGIRGWVSNWALGGEINWYEDGKVRTFSEDDRMAWARRKQAMEVRQEQSWRNAALAAAVLIRACEPKEHNYLHSKGLGDVMGLVAENGDLIVPMRHMTTNELQGAQLIRWISDERRYEKKMLPGMRAKGSVLRMGSARPQEAFYCEGYATGLSIEIAARQMRLNAAVIVCFSDSNMALVAAATKGRGYCFADNDKSGAGERAAKASGLPYCMSEVEGQDANDLHKKSGLMAVCKHLMAVRKM